MAKPENFDVHRLIEYLQGTTNTLSDAVETLFPEMTEDDLTEDDHLAIDNEIFLCEQCGWWCEVGEGNENPEGGGDLCNDCHEDTDED